MIQSTLTSKNQTTVPKAVMAALKLKPSDQLFYEIGADGRVVLSAKTETFASVAAGLPKKPKPKPVPTIEDMDRAIKEMAVKRQSKFASRSNCSSSSGRARRPREYFAASDSGKSQRQRL
jgi:bifunctional DNA-binding transcriptional regulator/antitoxin component of YhaV-PrlF toxin-antitoxin module